MRNIMIRLSKWFVFALLLLSTTACAMQMNPSSQNGSTNSQTNNKLAGDLTRVQFYVASEKDNHIYILDLLKHQIVGTIATGKKPANIVFSSTMRHAYVTNEDSGTVGFINTMTPKMTDQVEVGPLPHSLVITPDNQKLYVATVGDQYVPIVDVHTKKVINRIDLGNGAHSNVLLLDNQRLFVSDHVNNKVYIVDLNTNKVTRTLSTGKVPRVIRLSNHRLYVAESGSNQVGIYNPDNGQKTGSINVPKGPTGMVITDNGKTMVVTSYDANSVSVIDLKTNKIIKTMNGLSHPKHLAFNRKQTKVYATLNGANQLAEIDLQQLKVTNRFPVGKAPHGVTLKALPGLGGSCG